MRSLLLAALVLQIPVGVAADSTLPEGFLRRHFDDDRGRLSALVRSGESTPLVLLPGTFSDASVWFETLQSIPKTTPVVLLEMRGQGESWPPTPDNSIEELARDALFVLDRLGIENFIVGGHSLGGMTAIEIGRITPTRTRGIISVEGWTTHQAATEAFGGDMRSTLSPELRERYERARAEVQSKWGAPRMSQFATVWKRWNGYDFLASTDLPVLEIYGDRDKPRPSRQSLYLPDRPNIELVWVQKASHNLPLERPEELGRLITRFLEGFD